VGLYPRFQNNWWVVKFTPNNNRSLGLFEIGADLKIWIDAAAIANYLDFPIREVKKALEYGDQIAPKDVPQWIENFQRLFSIEKVED
jgi:hypothetical protein